MENKVKQLSWGNCKEWGKIQCPMLGNEWVMTYYPENKPFRYTYTAPFINEYGNVCCYRYDHDDKCWIRVVYIIEG